MGTIQVLGGDTDVAVRKPLVVALRECGLWPTRPCPLATLQLYPARVSLAKGQCFEACVSLCSAPVSRWLGGLQ